VDNLFQKPQISNYDYMYMIVLFRGNSPDAGVVHNSVDIGAMSVIVQLKHSRSILARKTHLLITTDTCPQMDHDEWTLPTDKHYSFKKYLPFEVCHQSLHEL